MPTRQVLAGSVAIGGGAPVTVQTMTNTDTRDVEATLAQIRAMADAGADSSSPTTLRSLKTTEGRTRM